MCAQKNPLLISWQCHRVDVCGACDVGIHHRAEFSKGWYQKEEQSLTGHLAWNAL